MSMTIKIPVEDAEKGSVCEKVEEALRNDRKNAYTISGLMVTSFGVKESDIESKPFSQWKKGQPSLYTKIRICLEKLVKEGKVKNIKKSKAVVYWWGKPEVSAELV